MQDLEAATRSLFMCEPISEKVLNNTSQYAFTLIATSRMLSFVLCYDFWFDSSKARGDANTPEYSARAEETCSGLLRQNYQSGLNTWAR
jgi:hypothetical protein